MSANDVENDELFSEPVGLGLLAETEIEPAEAPPKLAEKVLRVEGPNGELPLPDPEPAQPPDFRRYCLRCSLEFRPSMLAFHLDFGHAILECQLCQAPLLRFGITRFSPVRAQFCSWGCMAVAARRRLCRGCSREPDRTFRNGVCGRCRDSWKFVIREFHGINQALLGMEEARSLPAPYDRQPREMAQGEDQ